MRRVIVTLFAAVLLSLVVAVPSAGAFETAQQSDPPAGAPSIVPSPNERGKNNLGGLVVGIVLLGGWSLMGYGLYRQAQRRRATAATPTDAGTDARPAGAASAL